MVLVKICLLQLILFYQFYPPIATRLQRIIRGMYVYYNKNRLCGASGINKLKHTVLFIGIGPIDPIAAAAAACRSAFLCFTFAYFIL